MEKAIESDISRRSNVVDDVTEVVINEVPVEDVQVQVSDSTVVDGVVEPRVVVVNVDNVQGEIR
jgi:hypothetical protein